MGRSVLDKQVFLYLPCFQETESWHDRNTSITPLSTLCSCCSLGSYSSSWWFAIMFENQQKKKTTNRYNNMFISVQAMEWYHSGPEWIWKVPHSWDLLEGQSQWFLFLPWKVQLNTFFPECLLIFFLQTFQWHVENNKRDMELVIIWSFFFYFNWIHVDILTFEEKKHLLLALDFFSISAWILDKTPKKR